jgi:hypothetical protein
MKKEREYDDEVLRDGGGDRGGFGVTSPLLSSALHYTSVFSRAMFI